MSDWRTEWVESERYDAMWSAIDDWLRFAAPYGGRLLQEKYAGAVDKAVEAIMSAVDDEAREAEREACAAVALKKGSKRIAEAIRARGQEAKPTTD